MLIQYMASWACICHDTLVIMVNKSLCFCKWYSRTLTVSGERKWVKFLGVVMGATWLLAALLQTHVLIILHHRDMGRTFKVVKFIICFVQVSNWNAMWCRKWFRSRFMLQCRRERSASLINLKKCYEVMENFRFLHCCWQFWVIASRYGGLYWSLQSPYLDKVTSKGDQVYKFVMPAIILDQKAVCLECYIMLCWHFNRKVRCQLGQIWKLLLPILKFNNHVDCWLWLAFISHAHLSLDEYNCPEMGI